MLTTSYTYRQRDFGIVLACLEFARSVHPRSFQAEPRESRHLSPCFLMEVLTSFHRTQAQLEGSSIEKAAKGAYVLRDVEGKADITLVSTGSEVAIAVETAILLEKEGKKARVVSMPCQEIFSIQSQEYKLSVLPDGHPILSIEAMSTSGWSKWSHEQYGLDTFGASAPVGLIFYG